VAETNIDTERVIAFLDAQMKILNRDQWQESYQSWARAHVAWNSHHLGGTYTVAALTWYQNIHRPGSKEWRPSIIMRAVELHAGAQPEVQP
jgi:hypothetical protein